MGERNVAITPEFINPNQERLNLNFRLMSSYSSPVEKYSITENLSAETVVCTKGMGIMDGIRYRGISSESIANFQEPYFTKIVETEYWAVFRKNTIPRQE
jgi:hypothetical protein